MNTSIKFVSQLQKNLYPLHTASFSELLNNTEEDISITVCSSAN